MPDSLDQRVFDKELLLDLCPFADDLWITFMAYKMEQRITSLNKWRAFPITIYGTSQDSLWFINAQDGKNDEQWEKFEKIFSKMSLRNRRRDGKNKKKDSESKKKYGYFRIYI